jgi:hypothetical protein
VRQHGDECRAGEPVAVEVDAERIGGTRGGALGGEQEAQAVVEPDDAQRDGDAELPMVSTYTPIRATTPMTFAPTVLSSVWITMRATVTTRMVLCLVPSSEVPKTLLISVVR